MGDKQYYFWTVLRILLGLIFLWAFFDKLIGLGFTTCLTDTGINVLCESAWISGGSPTSGFLQFATKGPFASTYQSIAGLEVIDWLFMLGLLGIGLTLTFGFLIRLGSLAGVLLMLMMWTAALPPEHHPFLDEHIIYAVIMIGFAFVHNWDNWWGRFKFAQEHWILR